MVRAMVMVIIPLIDSPILYDMMKLAFMRIIWNAHNSYMLYTYDIYLSII